MRKTITVFAVFLLVCVSLLFGCAPSEEERKARDQAAILQSADNGIGNEPQTTYAFSDLAPLLNTRVFYTSQYGYLPTIEQINRDLPIEVLRKADFRVGGELYAEGDMYYAVYPTEQGRILLFFKQLVAEEDAYRLVFALNSRESLSAEDFSHIGVGDSVQDICQKDAAYHADDIRQRGFSLHLLENDLLAFVYDTDGTVTEKHLCSSGEFLGIADVWAHLCAISVLPQDMP